MDITTKIAFNCSNSSPLGVYMPPMVTRVQTSLSLQPEANSQHPLQLTQLLLNLPFQCLQPPQNLFRRIVHFFLIHHFFVAVNGQIVFIGFQICLGYDKSLLCTILPVVILYERWIPAFAGMTEFVTNKLICRQVLAFDGTVSSWRPDAASRFCR